MEDNQQNFVSTDLKIKKLQKDNEFICRRHYELTSNIIKLIADINDLKFAFACMCILVCVLILVVIMRV